MELQEPPEAQLDQVGRLILEEVRRVELEPERPRLGETAFASREVRIVCVEPAYIELARWSVVANDQDGEPEREVVIGCVAAEPDPTQRLCEVGLVGCFQLCVKAKPGALPLLSKSSTV
jgi:hypothetical protein